MPFYTKENQTEFTFDDLHMEEEFKLPNSNKLYLKFSNLSAREITDNFIDMAGETKVIPE